MDDPNTIPGYKEEMSRLEVLLKLLDPQKDWIRVQGNKAGIRLDQSVDSLVDEMIYEECVWARLEGYGAAVVPTDAVVDDWNEGRGDGKGRARNRTDHRAENVDEDFTKPLNVVRTPDNWAQRDSEDLRDDPCGSDAVVIGQFDRAGSDDVLDVFFNPNGHEPNYHVDWEYGGGLAHGHAFETRQELRGGISAMTYLINDIKRAHDQ